MKSQNLNVFASLASEETTAKVTIMRIQSLLKALLIKYEFIGVFHLQRKLP